MCAKEYKVATNGGLFHSHQVKYSKETHALLKNLIEESKLSIKQRQIINKSIKNGEPLPLPESTTISKKHHKNGEFLVPPSFPKRRNLDTILQSGAYERDKFFTQYNIGNSHKEKIRLQSLMAYGKEIPEDKLDLKTREKRELNDEEHDNEDDIFYYLLDGIKERMIFLKEMEKLGEAKAYRLIVEQEIASKLRQMEQISPEKCKQLDIYAEVKKTENRIFNSF